MKQITLPELIDKLRVFDELELIELLEITTDDLLDRFEDIVELRIDKLMREIE
jgi:hypothetical protein